MTVAPVTVVLPTIGRPQLVEACLESLESCVPMAAEILVVDSSDDQAVAEVVTAHAGAGVRRIHCGTPGLGYAFNLGLHEASHDVVLLTNDDCTFEASWVGRGLHHVTEHPDAIITGRVRPFGDPEVVPSTIDDPTRHEYKAPGFVLFTQCMALRRSNVLAFGGFDGRISPSAEDNDLSYRWLRAGRPIHYEPDFVAWHHDWRTRGQLERLYVSYGVGKGMVYGKQLRSGDLYVARYLASDAVFIARALAARIVRGRGQHADPRLGLLRGLPAGLARGWRAGREAAPAPTGHFRSDRD
jgi:GT2 family glycosyltransferase